MDDKTREGSENIRQRWLEETLTSRSKFINKDFKKTN